MELLLIVALAIFAGCILIAVLFGQHFGQHNAEQSAPGKQTAPGKLPEPSSQPKTGSFQVATSAAITPQGDSVKLIVVCDTATGQCWACESDNGEWRDCGSPLATKASHHRSTAEVA